MVSAILDSNKLDNASILLASKDSEEAITPPLDDWRSVMPGKLKALCFGRYRFRIRMTERSRLLSSKGSLLRGALMWEFRRLNCVKKREKCEQCPLYEECLYPSIFEVPEKQNQKLLLGRYTNSGAYLMQEPESYRNWYEKGEHFTFGLVLMGRANYAFPRVLNALQELGRRGFGADDGKARSRFVVEEVVTPTPDGDRVIYQEASPHQVQSGFFWNCADFIESIPEEPATVRVNALTALRMKSQGKWLQQITCADIIHHVLCRVRDLYQDHAMLPYPQRNITPLEPYRTVLMEMAKEVQTIHEEQPPRLAPLSRTSRRHTTRQRLDGWLGSIIFQDVPPPLLWLLRLAEALHVGKNVAFGCGRLQIEEFSSAQHSSTATPHLPAEIAAVLAQYREKRNQLQQLQKEVDMLADTLEQLFIKATLTPSSVCNGQREPHNTKA